GAYGGRAYLVYTESTGQGSGDTNIFVRFSDDNGGTWSTPVRVNDDTGANSQFLPRIALDESTGIVAVSWYDCRNDNGSGAGDRDNTPNTDAEVFAAFSVD